MLYISIASPCMYNVCDKFMRGVRWLSGRVSDSGARGRGFETYRRHVVSLSKTLYSLKVLVNYPGSGGSVVECRTPEREVGDSKPTAAVLCPWARHCTPRKYWLITQEAVAPSRHDWKIVDWDVKPQHKQTNKQNKFMNSKLGWQITMLTWSWRPYLFCEFYCRNNRVTSGKHFRAKMTSSFGFLYLYSKKHVMRCS